jgi:sugar phosphate isomerase/epimerase
VSEARVDRRQFLATAAALAAAGCARRVPDVAGAAGRSPAAAPLSFSTLGCPTWPWAKVLDFARDNGFAAIELRGLESEMDLSRRPEFAPERVAESRRQLADRGLRVVCLGASAAMHEPDPAKRAAHLAEARRFVDLARALGAPYVRVFGDRWVKDEPREATLARVGATLRELGAYAHERDVSVLLETHGEFVESATIEEIMRRADHPSVGLVWDAHHTFVAGKEAPEATARRLMPWVRHTHLKDSVPSGADRRYVLTGAGEVPVRAQMETLVRHGYRGAFGFEWEKRWHPEIEEPEVAFAHYAKVAREYLAAARP